jgi:hypothetical protein
MISIIGLDSKVDIASKSDPIIICNFSPFRWLVDEVDHDAGLKCFEDKQIEVVEIRSQD